MHHSSLYSLIRKEYKKQESAWVAAGNTEKYTGQNLEAYDDKIKQLKAGHSKYEKALNVLEYTMDHKDLLSDPLDDPLLLHTEVWAYMAVTGSNEYKCYLSVLLE